MRRRTAGDGGKPVRWSVHAVERLHDGAIDAEEARLTVLAPERIAAPSWGRRAYMRRYPNTRTGRAMPVRAIVDETSDELVVVTIYLTMNFVKTDPCVAKTASSVRWNEVTQECPEPSPFPCTDIYVDTLA